MVENGAPETVAQNPGVVRAHGLRMLLLRLQCPRCDSDHIFRSHRRSIMERMAGIFVLPYRCEGCKFRFFRLKWIAR